MNYVHNIKGTLMQARLLPTSPRFSAVVLDNSLKQYQRGDQTLFSYVADTLEQRIPVRIHKEGETTEGESSWRQLLEGKPEFDFIFRVAQNRGGIPLKAGLNSFRDRVLCKLLFNIPLFPFCVSKSNMRQRFWLTGFKKYQAPQLEMVVQPKRKPLWLKLFNCLEFQLEEFTSYCSKRPSEPYFFQYVYPVDNLLDSWQSSFRRHGKIRQIGHESRTASIAFDKALLENLEYIFSTAKRQNRQSIF